jgi:hypothetical protein
MRTTLLLATLSMFVANAAVAVPVPGLYNTGVDDSRSAIGDGAVDSHYALIGSADPSYPGPSAYACWPIAAGFWLSNDAASRWIGPAPNEGYPSGAPPHPTGDYTYRLAFDLTGLNPATVSISGNWGVDNSGTVLINGVSVATTSSYNPLPAFSITSGFVAGVNHLDFVVNNWIAGGANPTALRVANLSGTASALVGVPQARTASGLELALPVPNPAQRQTRIAFSLPRAGEARVEVRDLAGRLVRVLGDGAWPAGRSEITWDGAAVDGARARAGVYFLELESGKERVTRRLVRID